jgi:hypothetical protein
MTSYDTKALRMCAILIVAIFLARRSALAWSDHGAPRCAVASSEQSQRGRPAKPEVYGTKEGTIVVFRDGTVTITSLDAIAGAHPIIVLNVYRATVSPSVSLAKRELTHLRELRICEASVAPALINDLPKLGGLKVLDLSDTNVPENHLPVLGNLGTLRELRLCGTGIGDATMAHIARIGV